MVDSLFRPESTAITRHIPHNLRQILGIRYDIHVAQHLEIREVLRDCLLLERSDKRVIGVEIGNDLESAFERDDLPFEVSLQNPAYQ